MESVIFTDEPVDYPVTSDGGVATVVDMSSWSEEVPRNSSSLIDTVAYYSSTVRKGVVQVSINGQKIAMN